MKWIMKNIRYYIIGVIAVMLLAACSSARKSVLSTAPKSEVSVWNAGECVVARANTSLSVSKGKNIAVGGTLRMKRDDVIQLNLTYIFGIQVGTLEITQDSILVLSRTTRQYALFGYEELSALMGQEITFDTMQGIFWGEDAGFRVNGLKWEYASFSEMKEGRRMPDKYAITFSRSGTDFAMSLKLSDLKYESGWSVRTGFNRTGYERLSVSQVVKIISLLVGGK